MGSEGHFINSCAFFFEEEMIQVVIVLTSPEPAEKLLGKVRDYLRGHVIPGALPQRVHVLDEMPFTTAGKLDRKIISDRFFGSGPGGSPRKESSPGGTVE